MVSKEIVQRTIHALEDLADLCPPYEEAELAALGELLNFWRLYVNFVAEEETAC